MTKSMIKIISYPHSYDVEDDFKKWIAQNKVNILDISFNTAGHENDLWYSVMIVYEPI